MKYFLSLIIPYFFIACSNEKTTPSEQPDLIRDSIKPDTLLIGNRTYFIKNLTDTSYTFNNPGFPENGDSLILARMNSDEIFRKKDTLFLKTDKGDFVKLFDIRSEGDDYTGFTFIELNKDINQYVVYCSLYEAGYTLLVDKKDGAKTEVFGYPCVSPGKSVFVCGNCDLVAGFTPNGLQIYKKEGQKFTLAGSRELANWGPENMVWIDDSTLVIKGSKLTSDGVTPTTIFRSIVIK